MYCRNCGSDKKEIVNQTEDTVYYHCSNCDMADEEYKEEVQTLEKIRKRYLI